MSRNCVHEARHPSHHYVHEVRYAAYSEPDAAIAQSDGGPIKTRTIVDVGAAGRHVGVNLFSHYLSGSTRGELVFLDPDSARLLGRKLIKIADALEADYGA